MKLRFPWKWKKRVEPKTSAPTRPTTENLGGGYVLITTEHFDKQDGTVIPESLTTDWTH